MLEAGAAHADGAAADLHQVRTPGQHRLFVHPHQRRLELVGNGRRCIGQDNQVATADIDYVLERQRDSLAAQGLWLFPGAAEDPGDLALMTRRKHPDTIPHADAARGDVAAVATKVEVRPIHPLHGQAERGLDLSSLLKGDVFQMLEQGRPLIPGRVRAGLQHVVAT
ncbi:hypothetical protein D3C73_1186240 [compost metagenome]